MRGVTRALLAVLIAAGALAQEDADAKIHFQAGVLHYDKGDYQQALEEFEAAFAASQRPAHLYNIAQCHDKLGDARKTIEYLRRYLGAAPPEEDRTRQKWLRNPGASRAGGTPPPAAAASTAAPPATAPSTAASPAISVEPPRPRRATLPEWATWAGRAVAARAWASRRRRRAAPWPTASADDATAWSDAQDSAEARALGANVAPAWRPPPL